MEGGRKKEEENSMFETSHVLGSLLASSSLLAQAWQQCKLADGGGSSFAAARYGDTVCVAFSGVHAALSVAEGGDAEVFGAVPIDGGAPRGMFPTLAAGEGEEVLVQALALHVFVALYNTPEFQMLLEDTKNKTVIFTGHSIGGSIASLAALHLLCSSSCSSFPSSTTPLLCITFGSPLLGNQALSRAILRERWCGNFCHVVAQHDIMPRLLFCPLNSISPHLVANLQLQQFAMRHPQFAMPTLHLSDEEKAELHTFISMHTGAAAMEQKFSAVAQDRNPYRPFGSYALCSMEGAVCIDSSVAVQMLYVTFVTAWTVDSSIEAQHLCYGDLVVQMPQHLLLKKRILIEKDEATKSNYDAGISLALRASGIGVKGIGAMAACECLKMSKRMGRSPNLNCANLALRLGKITPCRAQIEWYKASCDDDMGYYDSFKLRKSPKKDSKANMNRIKLGNFWDDVINMLQNNQLPHDLHKRSKWVNAAQFYMLLIEPLDIAEYYRNQNHKSKGHYLTHGRERRYKVFDKWWKGKDNVESSNFKRSKFAGLTQDSCFWAKVEEAKEWIEDVRNETDSIKLAQLWKKLNNFESYSKQLVERKDVSIDVLAPHSSYSLWVEEWKDLKLKWCSK
ncbi:lipase-like PAD4 [Typha angustifolia]|uniref:lipase-like PAD4 n=1 Tax=Typha angustifolia TaxID=59011 RepID=UPI003C2DB20F